MFMNRSDIYEAINKYGRYQRLGTYQYKAAVILHYLSEAVDSCSDGWHSWPAPCRAAKQLQQIVQGTEPTPTQYKKAVGAVKAFMTRNPTVPRLHCLED